MLRSSPPITTGLADRLLLPPKKLSLRRYPSKLILNVDETPLPFEFLSGYTYDWKEMTTVAGKSDRSGWNKRQVTIVLHIMANGDTPFKPILIFYGQRTVMIKDQPRYNPRVDVYFKPTTYHNKEMFLKWLEDTYQPYIASQAGEGEKSMVVMDAAAFHKTPPIMKFLRKAVPPTLTALIPPRLTNHLQPLNTAVNNPFKKLLQQAANKYIKQLESEKRLPKVWSIADRRVMATHIMAMAWAHLSANKELIRKAFLNYSISIHSDGRENHLISIKRVENTDIDPNGYFGYSQMGNALDNYCTIPADDDLMTALVSATKEMRPPLKLVTKEQLQKECKRRRLAKSGNKPELLAKLQAHKAQQQAGGDNEDEVARIHITLGTPITINSPFSSPPLSPKNED
jgi:hypothetical protein